MEVMQNAFIRGLWQSRPDIGLALLIALVASGVSGCAYKMVPHLDYSSEHGVVVAAAPANKAQIVVFLWVATPKIGLMIYSDEKPVGELRYATWMSFLVDPGDHEFAVVGPKSADFTVGMLSGGKTYLLEAQNFYDNRYRLQPVTPDQSSGMITIEDKLYAPRQVTPNALSPAEADRMKPRRDRLYAEYRSNWLSKPIEDRRRITPDKALSGALEYRKPQPVE
jgi:hypothetical protein